MTRTLSKRDVLLALAALAVGASTGPALAQEAPLNLSAGRAIGEAYLAAHPMDALALRRALLPDGLNTAALERLRGLVASDFQENRLFVHQGWRLSKTEAQLFALLAGA